MPHTLTATEKTAAITEFNDAVAKEMREKKILKIQASANVAKRNPELHTKFLQATNGNYAAMHLADEAHGMGVGPGI